MAETSTTEIKTDDGIAPCYFFEPRGAEKRPAIIFYMDAIGVRPALVEMAARLSSNGYCVLLPDLNYRLGERKTFEAKAMAKEGPEREEMMSRMRSLSHDLVKRDTARFLEFLERREAVAGQRIGALGYCMGGGFALAAAGYFPDRIAAAASLHGGRLATDRPDSPRLLAGHMRGGVYVGIAGIDPNFTEEEKARLVRALESANVKHEIEVYAGVRHGFAVTDHVAYDREASERHWERILAFFGKELKQNS